MDELEGRARWRRRWQTHCMILSQTNDGVPIDIGGERPYLFVHGARIHSGGHILLQTELILGGLAIDGIVEVHRREIAVNVVPVQTEGDLPKRTKRTCKSEDLQLESRISKR